jgi:uncharacterized protein
VNESVLVDTGPLVAFLNREDAHHEWAKREFALLPPPLLTCEPVLAEATLLLERARVDAVQVVELASRGVLQVVFSVENEASSLIPLMRRYRNVPMSLADACLVRLSEMRDQPVVFTLDSDFRIYRRHGRLVIPTLMPPDR